MIPSGLVLSESGISMGTHFSEPQSSACWVIYVSLAASQAGLLPRAVYKAVAEVSDAPSSCLSQALSRVPDNSPIPALVGESVNCFQTCGMNAAGY